MEKLKNIRPFMKKLDKKCVQQKSHCRGIHTYKKVEELQKNYTLNMFRLIEKSSNVTDKKLIC